MNKTIMKIKQDAEAILAEANAKRDDFTEKIKAAETMEAEATEAMSKAYNAADTKAYHKAQDDIRSAKDAQRMFKDHLKAIDAEPLITKEEYDARIASVMNALDEEKENALKKIIDLIDQLQPIASEFSEAVELGNETMLLLQAKVYKDPKYLLAGEGMKRFLVAEYKDLSLVSFVHNLINNVYIKQQREEISHE